MVLAAKDIPATWDVTSDSLAVWLAGKIGAERVLLIKSVNPAGMRLHAQELAAQGVVDKLFPRFLAASGTACALLGPDRHDQLAAVVMDAAAGATPIDLP
jgi:aspartokinase-like uncharacterized kinase